MRDKKRRRPLWKKFVTGVIFVVLAIVLALGVTVYAVWHNEIAAVMSFEKIRERNDEHLDGDVYTMHIKGDFYLDEFVAQGGVSNDSELIRFVTEKITKGLIDMGISNPEIGCASFTAETASGDMLFARNYDFSKTNTCIVFTEANEGRHATISSVDLQFLGIDEDQGKLSVTENVY